ncbi:hypothetical protein L486_04350 [Kwoniella mangroviensis CBS 10435]|uniref:Uncharacterized protein n=1 Tax=Kwoniella mangroviensis CBS 10435 TaxID=1331196 RepID=A0A1B9IS20_9TREE|nr:hypothetical protein L486_04350 [Kwoniella mangroviensis CBS 10435]
MLTLLRSSIVLTLLSALALPALSAPLEKREDRTVVVNIPDDTFLIRQDPSVSVRGAGSHKFTFPPAKEGGTSTDYDKQEFFYDLYEEGSNFGKSLYHLTCYVRVFQVFGGNEEWILSRIGAKAKDDATRTNMVDVICPADDHSCMDGADCSKTPGWGK